MHSILIIGCGSIGERHLRCFQKTGRCSITICDTNPSLLGSIAERYQVTAYDSLETALQEAGCDAAVICTPAHLHLPIALKLLHAGLHLLIEKPLATDTALVPEFRDAMARSQRFVAVAYVYHFMPWLPAARACLHAGDIGRILHASVTSGQHFPTFRPAYREIYYARHEHGGGAIQDALTHLANAMEWLIGPCTRLFCDASHQELEGVTVEDTVNVSARHGRILASYALNQFQAPNETTFQFNGDAGSLKIEGHNNRWGTLLHGESAWTWHQSPPLQRDDPFIAQAHAFLNGIDHQPTSLSTFEEALQTLRFNQAALQSAATGAAIDLP